jgi:hypothetical protein
MLTRRFVLAACLGLAPTAPAIAQGLGDGAGAPPAAIPYPDVVSPPTRQPRPSAPGYDDDDEDYGITQRDAVRIARRRGLVDLEDIQHRRGVWIVSGTDDDGDDIRVVINDEGDVVDVRRD